MKPPTVFLGEMTNPEVEAFLRDHHTVIVPDRLDRAARPARPAPHRRRSSRTEVARRVAPRSAPLVAPADQLRAVVPARRLHRRRAHPDPDVHGADRGPVRVAGVDRLPADRLPERPLRQHVRDRLRLRERAPTRLPAGVRAFPVNYWDGMTAGRGRRVLRPDDRAPREPGRDLGGDGDQPGPRRPGRRQRRDAAVPGGHEPGAGPHRVLLLDAGLGPSRDPLGHVGRRARGLGRVRRALPRGRRSRRRSGCSTTSSGRSRRCRRAERSPRRSNQVPARITRRTRRSSSSSTRSARWPTAIRPRSVTPSMASGLRLAAATAAGRAPRTRRGCGPR